jgi:hypothetical protein
MIQIQDYTKMIKNEHEMLLQQVEGLNHADSLMQPQPGGNCLNWVMGHLVGNLQIILDVLDAPHPADVPDYKRYGYGSAPVTGDAPDVVPLETLVAHYGLLSNAICAHLGQMSETQFEEEIENFMGNVTRGWAAFFFFFHNTYHLGQLEQLSNLAGRTEKII